MTYVIAIVSVLVLFGLDRVTKYAAAKFILPAGEIPIIDGVFSLVYVENRGAAFGLLQGARWFFVTITALVLGIIVFYFIKIAKPKKYKAIRIALIIITAGTIGNFIDRFMRGFVVDFLYFKLIDFPVFNVADILVVCGTIFLALLIILHKDEAEEIKAL